ncbi:MAG TPA: hypothetical protein VM305_01650 [Candidatus Limnocylindrales bacterium]|nr:hypothetical protein [Candidatus Limnocylindrales bacterium]
MAATDLTLILPDRIGSLAQTLDCLRQAGVEVEGCAGFPAWAGEGILHVLVADADGPRQALRGIGVEIREERQLLVTVPLDGVAGTASVLERVAAAGVNVDLIYQLRDGSLALGVNDLSRAVRAAGDLAAPELPLA